jgi:hypothetical protein
LAVEATTTGLWPDLADRANDLLLGLSQVGDRGSPAEPFLGLDLGEGGSLTHDSTGAGRIPIRC